MTVAGLGATDRFGHSIACNSSGDQIVVGCPGFDNYAGRTYVYDRSIQRFVVDDVTQTEYRTVNDLEIPGFVSVTQNGALLMPDTLNIGGQYTVDISNPANQFVNISATLAVGDVIEVETNQFTLLQVITATTPTALAQYGYKLDESANACSLYIAAPFDSSVLLEAGSVEFQQNQSRVYGTITTTVANPTLTPGAFIRLDNIFVELTGSSVANLVTNVRAANVPNVTASLTANLLLEGDGSTKIFDVGTIYSEASSYTPVVYVDDVLMTSGADYTYNNTNQTISFVTAPGNTRSILVVSGRITFSVKNFAASQPLNRLTVLPGTGSLFNQLGLTMFLHQQTITSPVPQIRAHFGQGLFANDIITNGNTEPDLVVNNDNTPTLIVGAPNGSQIRATTFDANQTRFDSDSTNFADPTANSGAVYSFNALPAANPSIDNSIKFVFGQQFTNDNLQSLDQFGTSVDYTTGILLVGAPTSDFVDNDSLPDIGQVLQYHNLENLPAWQVTRWQLPVVDINLMNTVLMYDRISGNTKEYFDFFDPLQGRVLGVVEQNINYIGAVDPAAYNQGTLNNYGVKWGEDRVGQIWWDTNNVRFIDPTQSIGLNYEDIVYASRRWGQLFPGSTVDVYQWVVSNLPPAEYTGLGTPRSDTSYVTTTSLTQQGFFTAQYYFWVSGIDTVSAAAKKTLSATTVAQYIENPRSSGIAYIAPLNASTVAIYNGIPYISAQDTILHIEFDQEATEAAVHVEYQLIPQGRADGFLTDALYNKMLDSFVGYNTAGQPVPDPFLSPTNQYGVDVRPRQSMFANRFLALKNYLGQANTVLSKFPISETRKFNILYSAEQEPAESTGAWDKRVANLEELSYQDLNQVALGYKYLVVSDSSNNGLWTIYQVQAGKLLGSRTLSLSRVQNYDTKRYWNYIDWYRPNYNKYTRILLEVPNQASLETLLVPEGSAVKVTDNAQHKWEIFLFEAGVWNRVGLQDGTIEFSNVLWDYAAGRFGFDSEVFDAQYYDQAPIIETRKILEAINQELLIDDLLIERNNLLILMFNFILSEQVAPEWLTKTSLIDVDHTIRQLLPYQIYRQDNQDFVLNYINEVKPYHVQIREFNLIYQGADTYLGNLTDFDLPAYYDADVGMFISPILDDNDSFHSYASRPSTDLIWQTFPYNQWYQNYLLSIESVTVIDRGSGYLSAPTVTVTGDCTRQAVMTSTINSAGRVVAITILDPGFGYSTTATITLDSSPGTSARAVAVMGNGQIRSIATTIKYDRYQYVSTIQEWQPDVTYATDAQVRYANVVWAALAPGVTSSEFDPTQWSRVGANTLSGVDRTMGFYTPTTNQPGLDLAQLITGVDYPGVQVAAPNFNQDTGFDVGNFDINPFDNISYGPEGRPTYDPVILDAIYQSTFVDPFLGTLPSSINVSGGEFVGPFESHAPEELVPGITYDTLDFRVYTTPGADWLYQGHGWPLVERNFVYYSSATELNFNGMLPFTIALSVFNQTQNRNLILDMDYTIDWVNSIITVANAGVANDGDIITVIAYGLGGGNQLYTNSYIGSDIVDNSVIIPFDYSLITDFAIFANGEQVVDYSTTDLTLLHQTLITFDTTYTSSDKITITALGAGVGGGSTGWSLPITQYIIADGSLDFTLTNSLSGTNPANVIVNKNGVRARPSEGVEYIGDDTTVDFALPSTGGYDLSLVADNDVSVYVDGQPQTSGVDFIVDSATGPAARNITFASAPSNLSLILISVRTRAQYWIMGDLIVFQPAQGLIPSVGDIISVTTFNDTSEQNLLTQVFVGPASSGVVIAEGYDETVYDESDIPNSPGTFDYSVGVLVEANTFDTGRVITAMNRLTVTLDGNYLFPEIDYTVLGSVVKILGPAINSAQEVVITSFAQDIVPDAMAFRIFQDMRGLQSTYRITPSTTTTVVEPVLATDDVIYVADASRLTQPALEYGIFGLITINGERITYRNLDTILNTVSGLRRGTAGTGAADHAVNSAIYDIGMGNYLPATYQNYTVEQNFLGDGSTTVFTATDISVEGLDSTELVEAVQVYVGGILQSDGYTINSADPVVVEFDQAPNSGYQVSVRINRGKTWYNPGSGTASDGVPLQKTENIAARFLRGK